jgi:hypothetical protein
MDMDIVNDVKKLIIVTKYLITIKHKHYYEPLYRYIYGNSKVF